MSSCSSYFTEYLNTLGEIEGLLSSHCCDVAVIVVDFYVDFDCCCPHASC